MVVWSVRKDEYCRFLTTGSIMIQMLNHQQSVDLTVESYFDNFKSQHIFKNKIILYAGDTPNGVYFLKKGVVRQYTDSINGKELTIHLYNQNSFFPLSWAINHQIPDFNLETVTQCIVKVSPRADFINWVKSKPDVLYNLSSRLLLGLSNLSKRIEIISFENSSHRLMSLLAYLYKHYNSNLPRFTHEDLASLTGLTRERVSIEMKVLKDNGVIDYQRGLIKIYKPSKLAYM